MLTEQSIAQYPQSWDAFIGQEQTKRQLMVAVESAKKRNVRLSHVLLASGIAGIGKTALALLTALEMDVGLHAVSGKMTVNEARIALSHLEDRDVLFIDEIHRLVDGGKKNAEWLLHLLQDGVLMGPTGPEEQPSITVIAATTDVGRLPQTIISRFPIRPVLKYYSEDEAARIALKMADRILPRGPEALPLPGPDQLRYIARAGNHNPRTIQAIITNLNDLVVVDPDGIFDDDTETYDLTEPLKWLGLTEDGLTGGACAYLVALLSDFAGQAGVKALQDRLQEPGGLDHTEALLMQKGLIARTPQGRVLTKEGIRRANELKENTNANR